MFCVSAGVAGDIHCAKAVLDNEKCVKCGKCILMCRQNAIIMQDLEFPAPQPALVNVLKSAAPTPAHLTPDNKSTAKRVIVKSEKCIGCKRCKCKYGAIKYEENASNLERTVEIAEKYDAECVELHISTKKSPVKEIKYLAKNLKCPLSLCLDRTYYSNKRIKKLLKQAVEIAGPSGLIVQADGAPMSGGDNSYEATLQAVATAHLVQDSGAYILISGGTNSKTAALAKMCGLRFNGISSGSYARKLVKGKPFDSAVKKAKEFVTACKK
jgi:NAD-dependent dihydropyrimidine dehydrogenase PreA subunit